MINHDRDTVASRVEIGFPSRRDWCDATAEFDETSLTIAGHPVMQSWEQPYMESLAAVAARRGGAVLEVGYGMGISATALLAHPEVTSYLVIDCHPEVVASGLARHREQVLNGRAHFMTGFWQDVTRWLAPNSFNGILFDTYPLAQEEVHRAHFSFFAEAYRLLCDGGVFTYYSDEASELSATHREALAHAGFRAISANVSPMPAPADCKYWRNDTMLVPMAVK